MSSIVLTDEEQAAVDEGEAASFLLANPMFLKAIERVRLDCAEAILRSDPQAIQAREDAYNLSRALSAVTVELSALKSEATRLVAQAETMTEYVHPHEDDDIPADY